MQPARRGIGCAGWWARLARAPISRPATRRSSATSATGHPWSPRCGACATSPMPPPTIGRGPPLRTGPAQPTRVGRGGIGERYILGGENVRLGAMLAEIADIVGRRRPTMRFPIAALYAIAVGAEWFAHLTGKEPFATRDGLRMARHYMLFNDAKARRELGYTSRPYREAIADAIAWFKQAGYVR